MYIRSASSPSTVLWAFHTIQPSSCTCFRMIDYPWMGLIHGHVTSGGASKWNSSGRIQPAVWRARAYITGPGFVPSAKYRSRATGGGSGSEASLKLITFQDTNYCSSYTTNVTIDTFSLANLSTTGVWNWRKKSVKRICNFALSAHETKIIYSLLMRSGCKIGCHSLLCNFCDNCELTVFNYGRPM